MSHRALALTLAVLALVALALRVYRLEARPPHTDESVNAWILGRVLAGEPFAFDPRDRHGPLLPAAGLVVATILGRRSFADLDERTIRLAPAVVGAVATGFFMLGAGMIPHGVLATSAALWAFAPLPLYYSRYAIHETLLVAATLVFLLALARACFAPSSRARLAWAALSGAAAGAMLAAKLTAGIPFAAAMIALVVTWMLDRSPALANPRAAAGPGASVLGAGAAFACSAVLVITAAYTWGFTRFAGLHDLVFGMGAPLARAAGQGHEKGAFYLLGILGYGTFGVLFLLAALAGGVLAWRWGGVLGRATVIYAAGMLLVHGAIPYKTPWLALGIFLPLAVLAGWTLAWLIEVGTPCRGVRERRSAHESTTAEASARSPYLRFASVLGLAGFAATIAHADNRLVFTDPAAGTNPFAYAHTSPDLRRIENLVESLPDKDPLIAVSLADPWPLPFILRHHEQVGFWQPGQALPADADLVITTADAVGSLDPHFASWRPHYFTQRPGVMLVALQNPATEAATAP